MLRQVISALTFICTITFNMASADVCTERVHRAGTVAGGSRYRVQPADDCVRDGCTEGSPTLSMCSTGNTTPDVCSPWIANHNCIWHHVRQPINTSHSSYVSTQVNGLYKIIWMHCPAMDHQCSCPQEVYITAYGVHMKSWQAHMQIKAINKKLNVQVRKQSNSCGAEYYFNRLRISVYRMPESEGTPDGPRHAETVTARYLHYEPGTVLQTVVDLPSIHFRKTSPLYKVIVEPDLAWLCAGHIDRSRVFCPYSSEEIRVNAATYPSKRNNYANFIYVSVILLCGAIIAISTVLVFMCWRRRVSRMLNAPPEENTYEMQNNRVSALLVNCVRTLKQREMSDNVISVLREHKLQVFSLNDKSVLDFFVRCPSVSDVLGCQYFSEAKLVFVVPETVEEAGDAETASVVDSVADSITAYVSNSPLAVDYQRTFVVTATGRVPRGRWAALTPGRVFAAESDTIRLVDHLLAGPSVPPCASPAAVNSTSGQLMDGPSVPPCVSPAAVNTTSGQLMDGPSVPPCASLAALNTTSGQLMDGPSVPPCASPAAVNTTSGQLMDGPSVPPCASLAAVNTTSGQLMDGPSVPPCALSAALNTTSGQLMDGPSVPPCALSAALNTTSGQHANTQHQLYTHHHINHPKLENNIHISERDQVTYSSIDSQNSSKTHSKDTKFMAKQFETS